DRSQILRQLDASTVKPAVILDLAVAGKRQLLEKVAPAGECRCGPVAVRYRFVAPDQAGCLLFDLLPGIKLHRHRRSVPPAGRYLCEGETARSLASRQIEQ